MLKLLLRFVVLVLVALGIAWLADRPGSVTIQWLGREIRLSVFVGLVFTVAAFLAIMLVWSMMRKLWHAPSAYRGRRRDRKTRKAYQSLSRGIVAAGAGDAQGAARLAAQASEVLKDEPLVKLLGAQAAQLRGDRDEVKRVFESMAEMPDTELLGLRGLFANARNAGDWQAALRHAEAAHAKNGRLAWASAAMLQSLLAQKDWAGAARNIAAQAKSGLMPRDEAHRKQAAMLTARALALEVSAPTDALKAAQEAHGLDPALVPAALLVARLFMASGQERKAKKILSDTWAKNPHRDLAVLSGHVGVEEPEPAFERVRDLVGPTPVSDEGRFALARAAIAAQRHEAAREALVPFLNGSPQAGVCAMMAQIEDAGGNPHKSREWLARALHAPRDPLWVSDGVASAQWVPVSPVTGEIVPCEWKVPFEQPAGQLLFAPPQSAAPAALPGKSDSTPIARLPDDPGTDSGPDDLGS